jgi:hypothetical protein
LQLELEPPRSEHDEEANDKPEFSLITGKYRSKKLYGAGSSSSIIRLDKQGNLIGLAKEEHNLIEGEESNALVRTNQERGLSSRYRNTIGCKCFDPDLEVLIRS